MTQLENIRQALEGGLKLTPLDALRMFGCMRLAARIQDLKDSGYSITKEMVYVKKGEKRVARYSLAKQ